MLTIYSFTFISLASLLAGIFIFLGLIGGGVERGFDNNRIFGMANAGGFISFLIFFCIAVVISLFDQVSTFLAITIIVELTAFFTLSVLIVLSSSSIAKKEQEGKQK